jgi:hypothetical protein
MIDVVFKVINKDGKFVGFVKDSLLNLSEMADTAICCEVTTKNELDLQTKKYQSNLNKILTNRPEQNQIASKISSNVYKKYYSHYKLGELKVIPMPAKKYLL